MATEGLPLREGVHGVAVRDLQHRLTALGFECAGETAGFGARTRAAVEAFQRHRGLVDDGVCGTDTWSALVEAGYRLGDRLLYLRAPMLRGDDVVDLQLHLDSLGFDAGRPDGIFGPDTERALRDFQRNAGLSVDGVCGPDVLAALRRLGAATTGPSGVAGVRERNRLLSASRAHRGRRIAIGQDGQLGGIARAVERALAADGVEVRCLADADPSGQAGAANDFDAELFVGLALSPDTTRRAAYYAAPGFESAGGRHLAELLAERVGPVVESSFAVVGMRVPVLRETRMPAVLCHLGPTVPPAQCSTDVAEAVAHALLCWLDEPLGEDSQPT
ncbi:MAG: peptidoglycan-binding protein [Acidimicrobiales bacterium]|jgi:N-acetylmuramoyl-L-alanine amidase|nr:peptidoglycan-binding protein [Acidimicrobiales bacterium]